MLQSNINVISCYMFKVRVISAKAFFACLLIINHDISAAAEQGIDKIGNSVSERKNFTPMCSHVFLKKLELVTHTTKFKCGKPNRFIRIRINESFVKT